jgi:hypothetical protein
MACPAESSLAAAAREEPPPSRLPALRLLLEEALLA